MSSKIKVLIVDDSALIREIFSKIFSSEPDIEVVGTAADPFDAREKIKRLNPDVITLDVEMPKMDGISFLEKVMSLRPMPVIMISSLTQKGAAITIRALEIGAFDFVAKPAFNQTADTIAHLKDEIVPKIRAAAASNISTDHIIRTPHKADSAASSMVAYRAVAGKAAQRIIAIGSSTGGVEALRDIFVRLPENCPPIVMVQHMPENFTRSFAGRLDSLSAVHVVEAENHMRIKPGNAYLAPGGDRHMKLVRLGDEWVCKLEEGPQVSSHRPSVDVLFNSVAQSVGEHAVGVILTGMGKDGAIGLKAIRDRGGYTIGQNQSSCVVYGMPQAAAKIGATQMELPLLEIPAAILKQCEKP